MLASQPFDFFLVSTSTYTSPLQSPPTPNFAETIQLVQIWKSTSIKTHPRDDQIFAETMNNSNSNSNRGNSHIASRYTTHIAYNTESYKPIDMNTNPSINAYKHRIVYNVRIDRTVCIHELHPTPPTDDN